LTPLIRTKAKYETSLNVLRYISGNEIRTKSGFMVGLGEIDDEVKETINDLFDSGCRILTVGQYLQPSLNHMKAVSFISPEIFEEYRKMAYDKGFEIVECHPLVRSSFHAEKHITVG
jgi:lipoic acid synthetase